jgi:hypothetical protein
VFENNINLTKVMHKENKTTKGWEVGWDGRGQTKGQAQLDNKKQPAGENYSADGGKAGVTGNPRTKASSQKVKITPRMVARQVSQATLGQKRAARR